MPSYSRKLLAFARAICADLARRAYIADARRLLQLPIYLFVLLLTSASAQTARQTLPSSEEVDAYIQQGMQQLKIPGAAVALIADGEITHLNGFGYLDSAGARVTPQTPFQLGSVSKSFNALVILQLNAEGKLSLDSPVKNYIPYFRTHDKSASDQITVRHLLNHRSGITTLDGNRRQTTTYRGKDAAERAVRNLKNARLHATPGNRFQYSNANYAILADLIEIVEHAPYEQVLEARIFSKLGMKNSFVQIPTKATARPAIGHTQWFGRTVKRDFIAGRMMMGPGGVTASAEDLATYLVAVTENDPRIIPDKLAAALANPESRYEFAWEFEIMNDQRVIFHGGLNPGFWTMVRYKPETRQGALVLTNMSGSLEGSLVYGATDFALGLQPEKITPSNSVKQRLWGSLGLTVFLVIGALLSLRNLIKHTPNPASRSVVIKWVWISVPSLFLVGLSYVFVFVVPQMSGVTLMSARIFYPDLGFLLIVSAGASILWAMARTIRLVRPQA
jgi:CubicO group peptidase (beta-lactamase class C family)